MQRIEDVLRRCCGATGARSGFGVTASGVSNADLDDKSERLAGVLQAHRIGSGDRVAIFMETGPAAFTAVFAILKAGGIFCPVRAAASAEQLTFILNDSCATCLFVDAGFAPVAAAAMAEAPLLRLIVVCGAEGEPAIDGLIRFEDAIAAERKPLASAGTGCDPAMLSYTERGSAFGEPVATTHSALLDVARAGDISGRGPRRDDLVPQLLAVIAGMRRHRLAAPEVAA